MDPTSATGGQMDAVAAYQTLVAQRAMNQQRVEGQAALRLIDAALPTAQPGSALPPDATVSLRV